MVGSPLGWIRPRVTAILAAMRLQDLISCVLVTTIIHAKAILAVVSTLTTENR
jgi:hypothetical protein